MSSCSFSLLFFTRFEHTDTAQEFDHDTPDHRHTLQVIFQQAAESAA
jgi:hypothetical protein